MQNQFLIRKKFYGVYAALLTPFNRQGEVCETRLRRLTAFLLSKGLNGFYVCGSTGEGPLMDVAERQRVAEIVRDAVGARARTIVHVGGATNTRNAMALARHAERIGCDGVSSVFPGYYPYRFEEYFQYYKSLASSTALPFFIYYNPGAAGTACPSAVMERFGEIDNIVGLKFTQADFYSLQKLLLAMGGRWIAFSGPDELFLPALTMGVVGSIGSTQNILPEVFVGIYKHFQAGQIREAMRLQQLVTRVVSRLLEQGVIRSCKAALKIRGIDAGYARPPFQPQLTQAQAAAFRKHWQQVAPEYAEGI